MAGGRRIADLLQMSARKFDLGSEKCGGRNHGSHDVVHLRAGIVCFRGCRMLLDHVVDFARRKDFKRITLLTDKLSAESQDFFRKHGFDYSNMIPMRMLVDLEGAG